MQTDTEMNELVARKLGWKPDINDPYVGIPGFCYDIAVAWEIVEWLYANKVNSVDTGCCVWKTRKRWYCGIRTKNGLNYIQEYADTAPMAICIAFLKLP